MINKYFLTLAIILTKTFTGYTQSAQKTFTLSDTICHTGSYLRSYSVLFDFDKSTLKHECFPFLDSLVSFLKKNKNVILGINRYGDRTLEVYAMNLGQQRVRAIKNYLVSHGINPKRIVTKSYGETEPLVPQTETDKAGSKKEKYRLEKLNTRTELEILKNDFISN